MVSAGAHRGGRPGMIGVHTAQLDDAYQNAIWRGIEARARQRGIGVVCFVGHRIDSPVRTEAAANVAYRIADRRNIDALIVVSSAIATFMDLGAVQRMFSSRRGLPQVSLGLKVQGIPSVTVDGAAGMAAIVGHLVRVHGRRRFAVIGGPASHPEAVDRWRAFRGALEEAGIPFDERLLAPGTFLPESGSAAAQLLVESGLAFDALVCMNDRMALGALRALQRHGIRVPDEVAVVGFDGIEEGRFVTPPLTTVQQPLGELGGGAVDLALQALEGGQPADLRLAGTPVIRQSCGCTPRPDQQPAGFPPQATPQDRQVVDELAALARQADAEGFTARLNAALAASVNEGANPDKWNQYLSVVREGRPGEVRLPPALFEFARELIGEVAARQQAARRVAAEQRLAALRGLSASLAGAFEMPVMLERLQAGLSRLGIGGCYLALFRDRQALWSRLVLAPDPSGLRPAGAARGGIRFRTSRLLPEAVGNAWRQGPWVLEPLIFQDEPLGYLLFPGGAEEPAVYDSLPEQVASALKGALLLDQVRSHERRLEAEVQRRTAELTRANRELTREIERRLRLEREVSEISNRTMQRIGQDLHDDLCQHLAGIAMHASVLRGGLAGADGKALAAVEQIGALLEDSIARAKQIARGLYPAGLEAHGLAAAVEELVEATRRSYAAAIDFRASPGFALGDTERALQVYRIVQEALTNSLRHSGSARVEVRLYQAGPPGGRVLVAEVSDRGRGLPADVPPDRMGLRIMRYRAERAGAELRIESLEPGTRVSCILREAEKGA
jgi:DNA-binding LacI/PurR family transcriptional regulator/signal transduction histidine kinase